MPLLTSLGLVSLALGGLSGWLVLLATERDASTVPSPATIEVGPS